ncbi:STAS domain-containing protein [Chthonomonas calidirosea]|uniref:STAS domain-containing protein n=1 Tax=Chthonomonas calidirosea (strain DSM 23976 / ICMP 18418 / T49) TaxID=1303518 RepID=S0EVX0_CHTCT|nr:STAS domain-containing protein [Chthonomonas calidirosea]CCW34542.1 hypothetical protein CCALI_00717 [Chthonomonas calidirosea T49]CEK13246.1 STAS domain-containing protein [Chthonomonas calidirosea]CEK14486.1 STAS domain-containing protein [Chthonomonas calidirosea]
MIIETQDDVVRLSGSLRQNQWPTIRAVAGMLLHDHPEGIIIDCANLQDISEEGAKTFLEAMRDIEAAGKRIIVANLPEHVLNVIKSVPGIRSQLPIANSVEEARASLHRLPQNVSPTALAPKGRSLLVLLVPGIDLTPGAWLATQMARARRSEVAFVFLLEVPRDLPLNTPLGEQEDEAQHALEVAMGFAKNAGVTATPHIERVRDLIDGALAMIRQYEVERVVFATSQQSLDTGNEETFYRLVDALLHRAPSEVIVGRLKAEKIL